MYVSIWVEFDWLIARWLEAFVDNSPETYVFQHFVHHVFLQALD